MPSNKKYILLLNSLSLQVWQRDALQILKQEELATPVLIIVNNISSLKPSFFQKIKQYPFKNFLFRFWKRYFLNVPAQEIVPLPDFLKNTPVEYVETISIGKHKEKFPDAALDIMNKAQADFIIRFGFNILTGDVLHICKGGILSYHHGHEKNYRGGPPGFWEIVNRENTTSVVLQRLGEKLDAGTILAKRSLLSIKHSYSAQLHRLLMESTDMIAQVLRKENSGYLPSDLQPINTYPNNFQFLKYLYYSNAEKIKIRYQQIFKKEKWNFALARLNGLDIEPISGPLFPDKAGEYAADCFVWTKENKTYVVYEYYTYSQKKGSILLSEISDNKLINTKVLLENETHFAYPFLFEHENKLYVAPENLESGKWNAYELNLETGKVSNPITLINEPLVDASILEYENKYYVFAGLPKQANEALHIWYSDSIWGPYQKHPLCPVVYNPSSARMGGNFVHHNGEIFRPAQKSDIHYGEAIVWKKIKKLSNTQFEEEEFNTQYNTFFKEFDAGMHTVSHHKQICVIDFKKHQSDKKSVVSHFSK